MSTKGKKKALTQVYPEGEEVPFFDVQERLRRIDNLFNTRFRISGYEFKLGDEVQVDWGMLSTALNKLFIMGYVQQYKLLPPNCPAEILTGLDQKQAIQYVPILVANIMRKIDSNTIDISAPNNMGLVAIVDILSWYWFKNGGPRPETREMVKQVRMWSRGKQYFQNEVLSCPLCNKQFAPPASYKTQQSKFWAWVRWLPKHAVEYHMYTEPGKKSSKKEE